MCVCVCEIGGLWVGVGMSDEKNVYIHVCVFV